MLKPKQWEEIVNKWIPISHAYAPIHQDGYNIGKCIENCILGIKEDIIDTKNDTHFRPIPTQFTKLSNSAEELENFVKIFEEIAKIQCLRVNLGTGTTGYRKKSLGGIKSSEFKNDANEFLKKIEDNQWAAIKKTHDFVTKFRKFQKEEHDNLTLKIVKFCDQFQWESDGDKENPIYKGLISYFIKFFACIYQEDILPVFNSKDITKFLAYFEEDSIKCSDSFEDRLNASYLLFIKLKKNLIPILETMELSYSSTALVSFLYRFSPFIENNHFLQNLYINLQHLGFKSYPIDEQAFVGIFLALQNHKDFFINYIDEKLWIKSYYSIAEDFPDIIAENHNGDTLYIELEYDLDRYNHKNQESMFNLESLKNYYIICWKHSKNKKKTNEDYPNEPIIIEEYLKKYSLITKV